LYLFALGEMGMAEEAFWKMTLRQFLLKADAFNSAREEAWEHTRQVLTILINSNSKKKVRPSDIVELKRDKINEWKRARWHDSEEAKEQRELIKKNWLKDG
jgi:hypothetical protein